MNNIGRLKISIERIINTYKNIEDEINIIKKQLEKINYTINLLDEKNIIGINDNELNNVYNFSIELFDKGAAEYIRNTIQMVKIFIDNFDESEPQIIDIKNNYERVKRLFENKKNLIEGDISRLENRITTRNPNLEKYLSYLKDGEIHADTISEEELKDIFNIIKYTDFDEKVKIELITSFGRHIMEMKQKKLEEMTKDKTTTKKLKEKQKKQQKIKIVSEEKEEELTVEEIKAIADLLLVLSKLNKLPEKELNIITSMGELIKEGNIDDAQKLSSKYPIKEVKKYLLIKDLIDQMTEYYTIKSMKEDYYLKEQDGNNKYKEDVKEIINKIRNTLSKIENVEVVVQEESIEEPEEIDELDKQSKAKNIVIYLTNSVNNENYLLEDQKEVISNQKVVMKKIVSLINQLRTRDKIDSRKEETGIISIDTLSPSYISSVSSGTRGMIVYIEIPISSEVRDKICESYALERNFKTYLVVGSGIKSDKKHGELNNRMKREIFNMFDIINLFETKNIDKQTLEKITKRIDEGYNISSQLITNPLEIPSKKGELK